MVTLNSIYGFQQHLLDKNTFVSAGTVVKKPEFLRPSRNAQNVCAETKGGTLLKLIKMQTQITFDT